MKPTVEEICKIIESSDVLSDLSDVSESTSFSDIGIDSLEVFTVLLGVEEKYGVKIPDDEDSINTVGDIIHFVEKNT